MKAKTATVAKECRKCRHCLRIFYRKQNVNICWDCQLNGLK